MLLILREILRISLYPVRIQENMDQNNSEYGPFLRSINSLFCTPPSSFQSVKKLRKLIFVVTVFLSVTLLLN